MNDHQRPDPDQLLNRIKEDEALTRRGKLKIFFGASAGVGKTYAMLLAARQQREQGFEVVVGLVETHGRAETALLLEGLEILPRKTVPHRERLLQEFDLDGALAQRPALILVDELAHSNAPDCRHPKRWQDIEELLAAGIDVWTTVNVQHLESLNDIVGGITGIRVWETVPDRVFDQADEVVLVDLPPDELLLRLKEGKIYLPDQAERAIQNFFRKGNLIALREMALRRTADRVDDQMQSYREQVGGAPPLREALLACVGPGPGADALVRAASRLAGKLDCEWHALYVETPALQGLPDARRQAILTTLKLAQDLGAYTATLGAACIAPALVEYARKHGLSRLVVGRNRRRRWFQARSCVEQLTRLAPELDVLALARDESPRRPRPTAVQAKDEAHLAQSSLAQSYAATLLICLGTALAATPLLPYFDSANIIMLFLLAVVGAAVRYGRGPAVLAAVVNVAAFDIFFVSPRFSLAVHDWQYLLTFAVMLIVGLVIGQLTARFRYQAQIARAREERARYLYELSRELSGALVIEQVSEISERCLEASFPVKAQLLLPDDHDRLQAPPLRPGSGKPKVDLAIAQWCFDRQTPAGLGTDTLPAASLLYLPLKAPMRVRGVLAVAPQQRRLLLIPEQRRLLDTFAALIAIALERVHFASVARDTLVKMEAERQRNSLLAALSHDLRTPITALIGLAETLALELTAEQSPHHESLEAIRQQAVRMALLADNLLDMARLQVGGVRLRKDWQSLEELVGSATRMLEQPLRAHPLRLALDPNLPLIHCDAILIERVLVNLLENAAKYTPPDTVIGVAALVDADGLRVEVWDEGPGLPPGREALLFEKFTRGHTESASPGVGLGLAICQAIIEAHGGRIQAANRTAGGASFSFTLPLETPPLLEVEEFAESS